LKSRNQNWIVG